MNPQGMGIKLRNICGNVCMYFLLLMCSWQCFLVVLVVAILFSCINTKRSEYKHCNWLGLLHTQLLKKIRAQ